MTGYVVLLIVCAVGLGMSWLRYDAGKKRRETTARLAVEGTDAVASPTEELFRSEGIPLPPEMLDGLATATPPPAQKLGPMIKAAAQNTRQGIGQLRVPSSPLVERSDLDSLVSGVELPCELAPLVTDEVAPDSAVFVTGADRRNELHDELHTAFARIGCSVRWNDDFNAAIRRGPFAGEVSIEELPDRPELVAVKVSAS